ncbi:DUF885 family protein [Microvirga antarctica]|uniref:DUF885 family protein n=1 Tax=Microvirga antarctica TaxID=2819233 RepID=UPI001B30370B|nr:DUF885 family protein [Microvirga antarctica]
MAKSPDQQVDALVDDFLAHHFRFRPVDATFMGLKGHDDRLPPSDPEAPAREAQELAGLVARLTDLPPPQGVGAILDHSILSSQLKHRTRELAERSQYRDPSWYAGEAAFGLISLLLPSAHAATSDELHARLAAIAPYLEGGLVHLKGAAVHPDWVERARKEARAVIRLLGRGIRLHPLWRNGMDADARRAAASLAAFDVALAAITPADPACGADYMAFMFKDVHQLDISMEEAEARALERFAKLGEEIVASARAIDPERSWRDLLVSLDRERPSASLMGETYEHWHHKVMDGAGHLLTPATDYDLAFKRMPDWAQEVFADTYFLAYRSPPAAHAGTGSIYWVNGDGQNLSTVKQTHAIHHASIGHHTHNARARTSPSRLARLAETGVARGVAFLSAGTTGEGWACHVQHLAAEIPGILNRVETDIMLKDMERRNAGAVVADIRLHTGRWTLAEMRRFYAEEGGFGAGRVWGETVRNSIFPGTRIMYWLGQEMIREARASWKGHTRDFHDRLIALGHPTLSASLAIMGKDAA